MEKAGHKETVIFSFLKTCFKEWSVQLGYFFGGTTCTYQEASVIFINIIINSPKLMSLSKVTTFPAGVIFYHLPNKRIEMSLTSQKIKRSSVSGCLGPLLIPVTPSNSCSCRTWAPVKLQALVSMSHKDPDRQEAGHSLSNRSTLPANGYWFLPAGPGRFVESGSVKLTSYFLGAHSFS